MRPSLVFVLLFSSLVGCDQTTKQVASDRLAGGEPVVLVDSVLELRYAENRDVAFSILRDVSPDARPWIVGFLNGLAMLAVVWLWRRPQSTSDWYPVALVLVGAGAVGNGLDRVLRGFVVDFVHIQSWPIFNAADVFIVIGATMLVWTSVMSPAPEPQRTAGTS